MVLVLLLVTAGCGGVGDDSGDDTAGSTRPGGTTTVDETTGAAGGDFIDELDGVCLDLTDELDSLQAELLPIDPNADLSAMGDLLQQAADAYDNAVAAANSLDPPPQLQGRVDEFTGLMEDLAGVSQEMADAAASGDGAALEELLQSGPDGNQSLEGVADELGLTCFAATGASPGIGASADAQAYCDQIGEYVDAVDAYLADPTSADPGPLGVQAATLATTYTDLSAYASAQDRAVLVDCAQQAADAASRLLDAIGG